MSQKQHSVRLFLNADLSANTGVILDKAQSHYVVNVMRREVGDTLALFNGRDGEWLGEVQDARKNGCLVHVKECLRPQLSVPNIELAFAPVKKIQTALIIQKATELGAASLIPVQTVRTNADRLREDKIILQAIEAAEQSERLDLPEIKPLTRLTDYLKGLEPDRVLIFCQERAGPGDLLADLAKLKNHQKWAVLIGPEGGFTDEERTLIVGHETTTVLSLGPRILRAETAVISAMTLVQASIGDW
jgi:16S rRNA (uracil1498-N3)-methyltransferase